MQRRIAAFLMGFSVTQFIFEVYNHAIYGMATWGIVASGLVIIFIFNNIYI